MHKVGTLRMRMFGSEHCDYDKVQVEVYINFCLIEFDIGTAKLSRWLTHHPIAYCSRLVMSWSQCNQKNKKSSSSCIVGRPVRSVLPCRVEKLIKPYN
jgi:hypothetical protein